MSELIYKDGKCFALCDLCQKEIEIKMFDEGGSWHECISMKIDDFPFNNGSNLSDATIPWVSPRLVIDYESFSALRKSWEELYEASIKFRKVADDEFGLHMDDQDYGRQTDAFQMIDEALANAKALKEKMG